jgi:hypothetical protein
MIKFLFNTPVFGILLNGGTINVSSHPRFCLLTQEKLVLLGFGSNATDEDHVNSRIPVIFVMEKDYIPNKKYKDAELMQIQLQFLNVSKQIIEAIKDEVVLRAPKGKEAKAA